MDTTQLKYDPNFHLWNGTMTKNVLFKLFKPYQRLFISAIILQIFASLLSLVPWLSLAYIAYGWENSETDHFNYQIIFVVIGTTLGWLMCQMGAFHLTHIVDARFTHSIRKRLIAHLQQLPLYWLVQQGADGIAKIINNDVKALHQLIAHCPMDLTKLLITPIFIFSILAYFNITFLVFILIPISLAFVGFRLISSSLFVKETQARNQSLETLLSHYDEFSQNLSLAREYPTTGIQTLIQQSSHQFETHFSHWVKRVGSIAAIVQILLSLPFLLIWCLLGYLLIFHGNLPLYQLILFVLLAKAMAAPIQALGHGGDMLYQAIDAAKIIDQLFAIQPLLMGNQQTLAASTAMTLNHINFSYDQEPILKNINLHIPAHSTLAIVGPSGAGKSTLLHLMARFMDPDSGEILIDTQNIQNFSAQALYQQCVLLSQNAPYLPVSIKDNVMLFNGNASDEEIHQVLRQAMLTEKIQSLPQGIHTILDYDALLSGGERQRLALARALLSPNAILLLDEPTSALDIVTAKAITNTLLLAHRTCIIVTHDLQLAAQADQIIVMTNGEIVEKGHHEQLMQNQHIYTQLWNAQHD